jgi:hypothetical protein
VLQDGRVLIIGASDYADPSVLYDPATDKFWPVAAVPNGVGWAAPVVLQNGSVLLPTQPSTLYVP